MRLSNFTFLLWASLCLLCSGIGCSNSSTYEPLWNPPQQTDPEEPEEPDDVSFVVYNHLADSPDDDMRREAAEIPRFFVVEERVIRQFVPADRKSTRLNSSHAR